MDVRELLRPGHPVGVGAFYATISRNPVDFADPAYVTLEDFDKDLEFGPCRWMARDDTSLPIIGNQCLVIFDNRRNPWVIAWWPY